MTPPGVRLTWVASCRFQKPPIETGDRTASVEFVATRSAFHRQGVATVLLKHILGLPQFDDYILEVANTNDGAINLYEKAGFEEFRRIQEPRRRVRSSGIEALVYMRYRKHEPLAPFESVEAGSSAVAGDKRAGEG